MCSMRTVIKKSLTDWNLCPRARPFQQGRRNENCLKRLVSQNSFISIYSFLLFLTTRVRAVTEVQPVNYTLEDSMLQSEMLLSRQKGHRRTTISKQQDKYYLEL